MTASSQPRTSLLPPAPGRHHWCVLVPSSAELHFDGAGTRGDHDRLLVEALWARGLGCARFDLAPPLAGVRDDHPAAFGRHVARAAEVLERLRRMDHAAAVTLVATGDGTDVAFALARRAEPRRAEERAEERAGEPWPTIRSLLALSPIRGGDELTLRRKARDLAGIVARDERRVGRLDPEPVTQRLRRRLGL
jgi:hypothetical protein